jgi:hypothetical protein
MKAGVTIVVIEVLVLIFGQARTRKAESGNEASAIGSLRAVNSGEMAFASAHGGRYAFDLADLATPQPDNGRVRVSPDLSRNGVVKSGYVIRLERSGARGYFASAVPERPGVTGQRYFATDERGVVVASRSGPIPNPIPRDRFYDASDPRSDAPGGR